MPKLSKIAYTIQHMYSPKTSYLLGMTLAVLCSASAVMAQTTNEIDCKGGSVCKERSTQLPLRALPRPFSPIYKSNEAREDNILIGNVKPFNPVYIFARENVDYTDSADPKGWYRVGATVKAPLGWMQAKDLMEWKQALVVSYTHPGTGDDDKRNRVLMFDSKGALETVVGSAERQDVTKKLYSQIQDGQKPENVITAEPKEFLNIENTFYILPVIDFKVETRFDDEARLLQIAAAVPGQRSSPGKETTLANPAFMSELAGPSGDPLKGDVAKNLTVDIVFVMDMTNSMGPYIEMTKQAVAETAKSVTADPEVKKAVKFGFVGYRDSVDIMPQLEFTAKNFTPELLEDTQFVELVDQQVKAAEVGSNDYQEEIFAGVTEALNSTKWRDGLRFIVIVGDASSHEPGHPQSTTGLDAPRVRSLLDASNAYVAAIHLRDQRAEPDWTPAEAQLSAMATNKGTTEPLLVNVNVDNPADFKNSVELVVGKLGKAIAKAQSGMLDPAKIAMGENIDQIPTKSTTPDSSKSGIDSAGSSGSGQTQQQPDEGSSAAGIDKAIAAALIDYLGSKEGKPPRDVTAWVMDRDLIDPRKKALDVRLLISRDDLNSLIIAVERVNDALATAEMTNMKFFESLRTIVTQGVKGEDINFDGKLVLSDAKTTEQMLVPKWIEGLPYKSAIQDMSDEKFEAMTPDQRAELDKSLKAKLQFYKDISEKVDAWVALSDADKDSNSNKVYPLKLEDLP